MWLVKKLRKELGIPAENVLRHYDIVNKVCPAPYVHNNKYRTSWTWSEFKRRISDASGSEDTKQNAGSSKTDAENTSQKMRYVVQCGAFAEKKNAEVVIPDLEEMDEKVPVGVTNSNMVSLDDFEADDAPVLPQDDEYDLQKELEAKFDELFGPIDDDN